MPAHVIETHMVINIVSVAVSVAVSTVAVVDRMGRPVVTVDMLR